MPQIAIPIVIAATSTTASAAAAGTLMTAGFLSALAVNVAIGAAVGVVGMIAENKAKGRDPRDREINDQLESKSQRNIPLPVVFGRGRVACNYLQLGNFFMIDDFAETQGGTNFYVINAIMGISEGKIRATGNWNVNGLTLDKLEEQLQLKGDEDEKNEKRYRYLYFDSLAGHPDAALVALGDFYDYIDDSEGDDDAQPAFTISDRYKIPYRNTAIARVRCVCGAQGPDFLDVSVDVLGQEFTLYRTPALTESTVNCQVRNAFYDGFSESWYATMFSRSSAGPWGLYRYGRNGGAESHTPPPDTEPSSIANAWYLGRHDLLVMQSNGSASTFYVGSWGLARDSEAWKTYQPDPNYAWPMLLHHLDELHGVLHSLHYDDDVETHFIMRWNLLTGSITRIDTSLGSGDYRHLVFAPDINAYVVISEDRIHLLSVETGAEFDSRAKDNTDSRGAFVSGRMIGVMFNDRVRMWDYLDNQEVAYNSEGSSITSTEEDGTPRPFLGSMLVATQNTWTGHVAIGAMEGSQYAFATFIPSVVEPEQENTACGTPDVEDFTPYDSLLGRKWVRDWSYRKPSGIKLRLLEGESSIAAALYASIFAEQSYDSERWGGGVSDSFASLSSFESLHSRCVAPERYLRSNSSRWENGSSLKRAYEFDMRACGPNVPKYTELFEPDDATPYTWRSAEGGVLWLNKTDSPLYEDLGDKRDGKFILRTSKMNGATPPIYMYAAPGNSMSPPTSTDAWDPGKNSYCGVIGRGKIAPRINAIRAKPRAEDTIDAPEQDAEMVYMERYKVDYVLDAQTALGNLIDDIFLAACNGYRTIVDGKLHVGVPVPGRLAMMNLTDDLREGSGQLTLAAGQQPNLLVYQYTNRFDDYRQDFQQAHDHFEADAIGQTLMESPSNPGVTRPGHAQKIVSLMRDTIASHKRQYKATFKYTGLLLSPGDCVAIWDRENGLEGDLFIINSWEETDSHQVQLICTEHVPLTSGIRQSDAADPPPVGTGGNPPLLPGRCERVRVSAGTDTVYFNNGALYPKGEYTAHYIRDAVMQTPTGQYVVDDYSLVTHVDGSAVVIGPAPCVPDPTDGYATMSLAKAANNGKTQTFNLALPGPIGIRANTSTRYDNADGNTIYELCFDRSAGGTNPGDPGNPPPPPPPPPIPTNCAEAYAAYPTLYVKITGYTGSNQADFENNFTIGQTYPLPYLGPIHNDQPVDWMISFRDDAVYNADAARIDCSAGSVNIQFYSAWAWNIEVPLSSLLGAHSAPSAGAGGTIHFTVSYLP